MEYVSDVNIEKQLIAIVENNSLKVRQLIKSAMGHKEKAVYPYFPSSEHQ
jgi:hypothetical protein